MTDPADWYPPWMGDHAPLDQDPVLGFAYVMLKGKTDGRRATFYASPLQIYSDWCALQTSYYWNTGGYQYNCIPNGAGHSECAANGPTCGWIILDSTTRQEVTVSKAQDWFCGTVYACQCNETGCGASMATTSRMGFDLRFEGNEATGTYGEQPRPARLNRVTGNPDGGS